MPARGSNGKNGRAPQALPLEHASVLLAPIARWSPHRKARIVAAIDAGVLREEQVAAAHGIEPEELRRWRDQVARGGIGGLRVSGGRDGRQRAIGRPVA